MFCQNCGKEIAEGTRFCPHCGAKNENAAAPVPPVSQPAPVPTAPQEQQPVATQAQPVISQAQPIVAQPQPNISQPQPAFTQAPVQPATPITPGAPAQQGFAPAYPVQAPPKKKSKAGMIIGIVLGALVFIIVLAVIGASMKNPAKKVYGEWNTSMDLGEEMVENMDELKEYMDKDFKFDLAFTFVFNEDGTYKMVADEDSFNECLENYKTAFKAAFKGYFRDKYTDYAKVSDAKLEEVLAYLLGEDLDSYVDKAVSQSIDYQTMAEAVDKEGKFEVEEDKIYFSAGLDYGVDENVYAVYHMPDENTIVITDYLDNGVTDEGMFPLPLTLTKAG